MMGRKTATQKDVYDVIEGTCWDHGKLTENHLSCLVVAAFLDLNHRSVFPSTSQPSA